MTQPGQVPISADSQELPQDITSGIVAFIAQLDRLGVRWRLRPATVADPTALPPLVTMDGDTDPIPITASLIGSLLPDGRVWVVTIPPSGNYVIGFTGFTPLPTSVDARVSRNASQSILHNTNTDISFDTVIYDNANFFDTGSPTVLTAPFDGKARVTAEITFAGNTTGFRGIRIMQNGGFQWEHRGLSIGSSAMPMALTGDLTLVAGDTISLNALQTSGIAINATGFMVVRYDGA